MLTSLGGSNFQLKLQGNMFQSSIFVAEHVTAKKELRGSNLT